MSSLVIDLLAEVWLWLVQTEPESASAQVSSSACCELTRGLSKQPAEQTRAGFQLARIPFLASDSALSKLTAKTASHCMADRWEMEETRRASTPRTESMMSTPNGRQKGGKQCIDSKRRNIPPFLAKTSVHVLMLKVCGKHTACRLNSRVPLFVQF